MNLTFRTSKLMFPCSMMVPHQVAVFQEKMPSRFREGSPSLRLAPLPYSVLSTMIVIRVAENITEGIR